MCEEHIWRQKQMNNNVPYTKEHKVYCTQCQYVESETGLR